MLNIIAYLQLSPTHLHASPSHLGSAFSGFLISTVSCLSGSCNFGFSSVFAVVTGVISGLVKTFDLRCFVSSSINIIVVVIAEICIFKFLISVFDFFIITLPKVSINYLKNLFTFLNMGFIQY